MRKFLAAATLALLIVTSACGPDNHLTYGEVIEKEYDDWDTWWTTTCVAYGKYGCKAWVPIQMTDPPHWHVKITGRWEGKQRTEKHEISAGFWNKTEVGDEIDLKIAKAGN